MKGLKLLPHVGRMHELDQHPFARAETAGFGRRYRGEGFGRMMHEKTLLRLDRRLAEGRGLWIFGDTGTGKTTLAMLISKAALEAGHSVAIYSLPKLLARIRRTYDSEPGGDSYLSFFERLTSVDLLHIDDLGAEKRTDWVLEQLYALVNERYERQRSLIVTSNFEDDELEKQLGMRIVSRLVDICGDPVLLFGEDRRMRVSADVATSLGQSGGAGLGPLDH